MNKEKLIEVVKNVEDKSNKDLFLVVNELYTEYEKTKQLIIDLTRHLETVEGLYNDVNNEIGKRTKK